MAAMPARPSLCGTVTPYTLASGMPGNMPMTCATSLVAQFSPFQRKVSPMRSTKKALLCSSTRSKSPERNQVSLSAKAPRSSFLSDSAWFV
jgi:hypothetical protein